MRRPATPRQATGTSGVSRDRPDVPPCSAPPPVGDARSHAPAATIANAERWRAGLYIVATPIGNLGDITLRALEALRRADAIACEDTRITARLLAGHGIARPLVAYHDHNAARVRPRLIQRLERGETLALVSDAGTPLVADPGFRLVKEAIAAGIHVTVLPGPSAALAALVVSGLPSDRFLFAGFLPPRSSARRTALGVIAAVPATLLFLESPGRLAASLADMHAVLGDRDAAVARELTKLHEEVRRGRLAALAATCAADPPRGEVVVVVGPPAAAPAAGSDLDAEIAAALATMTTRDAAAVVAAATGLPRRDVYRRALDLATGRRDDG
jgi:16S rRNA (cytidine1402-2'-O)-methyltransferase